MKRLASPAMPIHVGDLLRLTLGWPNLTLHRGALLNLAMFAWDAPGGTLPADEGRLARIAGLDASQWSEGRTYVLEALERAEGGYRIPLIEDQRRRLTELSARRQKAGRRGAASRWQSHADANSKDDALPVTTGCPPDPDPDPSPKEQKEQRGFRRAMRAPDQAPRVLRRLAHEVLDDVEAGRLDDGDAKTELKARAARAYIAYDAAQINQALDSAEYQRAAKAASA